MRIISVRDDLLRMSMTRTHACADASLAHWKTPCQTQSTPDALQQPGCL